jgi:hypothetical protein
MNDILTREISLYGLNANDLTEEQLQKVHYYKLIEIADTDDRIPKILADRLPTADLDQLSQFRTNYQKFSKDKYFLDKYNEFYRNRSDIHLSWQKHNFVFWSFLDDKNKATEAEIFKNRGQNGQYTILDNESFDFIWGWNHDQELTRKIADKIFSYNYNYYCSLRPFIQTATRELYLEYLPKVLSLIKIKKYGLSVVLLNEHTPERNAIQALRSFSKSQQEISGVKFKITKAVLQRIPPVMRLNALEKILVHKENYQALTDIQSPDDLKELVFGTTIKYPSRVEKLLKTYKWHMEQK